VNIRKITINILDLKAMKILWKLEDDNLISIEHNYITDDLLSDVVPPITMDEIVKEVKIVRQEMYDAKQKRKDSAVKK